MGDVVDLDAYRKHRQKRRKDRPDGSGGGSRSDKTRADTDRRREEGHSEDGTTGDRPTTPESGPNRRPRR